MKMQKKLFAVLALATIAVFGISLASAFGLGKGFIHQNLNDTEKAQMKENIQSIRTAIQDKDYDTWKSLMEEQIDQMKASLTQENFDSIVAQQAKMEDMRSSQNFSKMEGPRMRRGGQVHHGMD